MPGNLEANELALKIYKISEDFPGKENFGITSQIRRAAIVLVDMATIINISGTRVDDRGIRKLIRYAEAGPSDERILEQ
jgi:hypothetical protein